MAENDWLEDLWDNILSEDAVRILAKWRELSEEDQLAIWEHLNKMSTEDGWADVQRDSAQAAINALKAAGER
ncbi:MAG: hypothetical protein KF716_11680 [Anaerolineae bacterium]|nr:hypothetical protein [Anaerolineae bacterium]